ncbi:MAG: rhomboid family intramembrane serine protease [Acidobacteria bacterium]|nr:rhomboid family intramembrane serine protease [Acidobacteriota bacterium]
MLIPISHDRFTVRNFPWVSFAIMASCIAVFFLVDDVRPWAFVAAEPTLLQSFTSMFFHGSLLHLLSNLFFFYLCGPFIEDRWGHFLFLLFYLGAGIFAAVLFAWLRPDLTVPAIGASGAIAGVMGAFLVCFWRTKIEFFYWYLFFMGRFSAPAWIMLLLWIGREILFGVMTDAGIMVTGVGHWAHVGGFGFGVTVALTLKWLRVGERAGQLPAARRQSWQAEDVADVFALLDEGRGDEVIRAMIEPEESDPPPAELVHACLAHAATPARRVKVLRLARQLTEVLTRRGDLAAALGIYRLVQAHNGAEECGPSVRLRLMEYLLGLGLVTEAAAVADEILTRLPVEWAPGLLIQFGRMLARLGKTDQRVLELVRVHTELPDAVRQELLGDG